MNVKILVRSALMDPFVNSIKVYVHSKNSHITARAITKMEDLEFMYVGGKYDALHMYECKMEKKGLSNMLVIHCKEDM